MEVVEQFIARYTREFDYYGQVGRIAQAKLESILQEAGIRAIVTSRAKSITRLREKCRQRDAEKSYSSVEQIYDDIADLVGVRVALYFPSERDQVDGVINRSFNLTEPRKEFPDPARIRPEKRFSGYSALHYRVRLQENDLLESEQRYALAKSEIQVASVLMHAWSEVEHDLIYKPLAGALSVDEYAILDQLNGLVLAGEISLERLQVAGQRRVTTMGGRFANHFDLASYLLSHAARIVERPISDAGVGRVDLLFKLLVRTGINTAEGLAPYVEALHGDLELRPLAEQLIDALIDEDASRFNDYQQVREQSGIGNAGGGRDDVYRAMGEFLSHWNELEQLLRQVVPPESLRDGRPMPTSIAFLLRGARRIELIDERSASKIDRLRRLRNELVHGLDNPPIDVINDAIRSLATVVDEVRQKVSKD